MADIYAMRAENPDTRGCAFNASHLFELTVSTMNWGFIQPLTQS